MCVFSCPIDLINCSNSYRVIVLMNKFKIIRIAVYKQIIISLGADRKWLVKK